MFSIVTTCHNMNGISIKNPTPEQACFLKGLVCCNRSDTAEYRVSKAAGAFLQGFYKDYVLIEFWSRPEHHQQFVDYCNEEFPKFLESLPEKPHIMEMFFYYNPEFK